ncbi:TPA: 50S ribosomal protein L33 [Candidatus Ventrenecus avicola]|nr:50S ribosomal protein L33 [Candidatus Ventrenecus avicola]
MAKNENRQFFGLKCTVCGYEIRPTEKNKKNTPDKMEIKKYCPKCRKVTAFKETKLGK